MSRAPLTAAGRAAGKAAGLVVAVAAALLVARRAARVRMRLTGSRESNWRPLPPTGDPARRARRMT